MSFSIAREWTDRGTPSSANNSQETTAHHFDLGMLLQLATLGFFMLDLYS